MCPGLCTIIAESPVEEQRKRAWIALIDLWHKFLKSLIARTWLCNLPLCSNTTTVSDIE